MKESELDKFFEPEETFNARNTKSKCIIGYFGSGDSYDRIEKEI